MTPNGVRFYSRVGRFFVAWILRERRSMANNKDKKTSEEVIISTDDTGAQLYLSEKAASRAAWILTGALALLSMPVIILAFMMI